MKHFLLFLLLLVWSTALFAQGDIETVGMASFYANKFEGRRTSSGEIFHQRKFTCAHRTLPFGTQLLVTNLANQKSVVVTVNDRGPYGKGRVVDLTTAAAKELDFIKDGTTRVQLEILIAPADGDTVLHLADSATVVYKIEQADSLAGHFTLQLSSCARYKKAQQMIEQAARELNLPVYMRIGMQNRLTVYTLYAGNFNSYQQAFAVLNAAQAPFPAARVVAAKP